MCLASKWIPLDFSRLEENGKVCPDLIKDNNRWMVHPELIIVFCGSSSSLIIRHRGDVFTVYVCLGSPIFWFERLACAVLELSVPLKKGKKVYLIVTLH